MTVRNSPRVRTFAHAAMNLGLVVAMLLTAAANFQG